MNGILKISISLSTAEIIHEAESLPVEERALVITSLLCSLNQPNTEIDKQWMTVANRRREALRTGKVTGVTSEVLLAKLQQRNLLHAHTSPLPQAGEGSKNNGSQRCAHKP